MSIINKYKKKHSIRLLILAKQIDGGTGTFIINFLKIKKYFRDNQFLINTIVLEKPSYRQVDSKQFTYYVNSNHYPQKYKFSLINTIDFLKETLWVKKGIKTFKPEVVLSIDSHCILLSEINKLIWFHKLKTIATIHNNLSEAIYVKSSQCLYFFLNRLLRYFLKRSDRIVCVSKDLAYDIQIFFRLRNPPDVIHYGIDKPLYESRRNNRRRIILSIARFVEQKDHRTLIYAFHQVHQYYPHVKLQLVGDGPLKRQMINLVKDLGLTDAVKFRGWIQNPYSVISNCDIFILASKREGFGYALLEAMQLGRPVISTDCPYGPAEILGKNKYGLLVQKGNVQALFEAMLKLLRDSKVYDYYSKAAESRSKDFSIDKMLKAYKEIIGMI